MPNNPGATLVGSFIEVITAGATKYALDDTGLRGGFYTSPTQAGLSAIPTQTRKAGRYAFVMADESHGGSPALYQLANNLSSWLFLFTLGTSSATSGAQYTFAPASNPDETAEANLVAWLATAPLASTVVCDFRETGGSYNFSSEIDLNRGAMTTTAHNFEFAGEAFFNANNGASLRNIGRLGGGLLLGLSANPGQQVLFFDDAAFMLIVEDLSGIFSFGGDSACVLNGQLPTVIFKNGGYSANEGAAVLQATNSTQIQVYGFDGTGTVNASNSGWVVGDTSCALVYFIDDSFIYPGPADADPLGNLMPTSAQYTTAGNESGIITSPVAIDFGVFAVPINSEGGAFAITLPPSPPDSYEITIVDSGGFCNTHPVSVTTTDGSTIKGGSTYALLTTQYQAARLRYFAVVAQWAVIGA